MRDSWSEHVEALLRAGGLRLFQDDYVSDYRCRPRSPWWQRINGCFSRRWVYNDYVPSRRSHRRLSWHGTLTSSPIEHAR